MAAQGAELVVHGRDFQASLEHARDLADADGLRMVPSFHPLLVRGRGDLRARAVPRRGPSSTWSTCPSGSARASAACWRRATRSAWRPRSSAWSPTAAPCYQLSFEAGRPVSTATADTFADGLACRVPDPDAVDVICRGVSRIVAVTEDEIAAAMRAYYTDTHNVAEGAGAAPLAAARRRAGRAAGQAGRARPQRRQRRPRRLRRAGPPMTGADPGRAGPGRAGSRPSTP